MPLLTIVSSAVRPRNFFAVVVERKSLEIVPPFSLVVKKNSSSFALRKPTDTSAPAPINELQACIKPAETMPTFLSAISVAAVV